MSGRGKAGRRRLTKGSTDTSENSENKGAPDTSKNCENKNRKGQCLFFKYTPCKYDRLAFFACYAKMLAEIKR